MDKKYKSLCSQIVELLELEHGTPEFDQVFIYCLEHLCLQTDIKSFHNRLKSIVDFKNLSLSPSKFRLAISKSGYLLLNLRFHVVYLSLVRRKLDDFVFEYYMFQHQVDPIDNALLTELLTKNMINRKSLRTLIRSKIPAKDRELYAPVAIQNILDEFNKMLPDIKATINRVIYKRLRFVMRTYNMTRDEFISELLFSAIRAHYKSKPNTFSFEKSLNVIRRSIDNYAVNLIKAYTTNKRERLVNEGKDAQGDYVFSLRVVSENQMNLTSMTGDDVDISYDSMFSSSLRIGLEKKRDIEFSVDQLMRRYGVKSRRGRLLSVYFSPDCTLFRNWLIRNKYLRSKNKTTQEFMDSKTTQEFMDILSAYLDTTVSKLREIALPGMARALDLL
ncbi:hypothetical protein BN7874_090 [Phage NCTB]|nr:hypothetical protein BN7874_090 [Phage NCTB]